MLRTPHALSVIVPALLGIAVSQEAAPQTIPRLRVSDNHRYLVTENGGRFFYLADTAWELLHRLNREDVSRYLDDRKAKGFTVFQTVALAEFDGVRVPNAYGHLPLANADPSKPLTKDGPDNDFWDHVDHTIREANKRGIYVALLPTWGDKWNRKWGKGPEIFTPENAAAYGRWLGARYRNDGIIWVLGGDRPIENDRHRDIIRAMATGLREGDGGAHLITFHPTGARGSAENFHQEPWLDFNMRQNGHSPDFSRYAKTRDDYRRAPIKPVVDGEPIYEDHPVDFKGDELGTSVAADVRLALYWDLLGGAFGHTYGNHAVWQMYVPGKSEPINRPVLPWPQALNQPGAVQMHHGIDLLKARNSENLIPDDSLIVRSNDDPTVPGAGRYRIVAARDEAGAFALVYTPVGRMFSLDLRSLRCDRLNCAWYDPRTGKSTRIGSFENRAPVAFTPPSPGEFQDWVLIADNAGKAMPLPGESTQK